jgi:signal peptidase I
MADEVIPPASDNVTSNPLPRTNVQETAARGPAPRRPAPPAPSTLDWIKIEAAHVGLLLAVAAVVVGALYFLGYDIRFDLVAGAVVLLLGRSLTGHVLPDHATGANGSSADAPPTDTVREIIETIVFVVVLVLLLKSFVAEAFVIPTGSMATTLWGYQKVVDCPECGYRFPVNSSSEADPQDNQRPIPVVGCTCPNCRYAIDFANEAKQHPKWEAPTWSSGDRVLVAKFLYDLLGRQPERLDVVVFKFPGDASPSARWPVTGPFNRSHVPINYIKRLVGEPGEVIAVHGGNLYRIPAAKVPQEIRDQFDKDAREADRNGAKNQLWQTEYTHTQTGSAAREFFENNRQQFQIIRKPPETMLAERRIVYDNDHPARDLPGEEWERWKGWSGNGRAFAHPGGTGEAWLRYQNVLREHAGKPQLITDFMGYNSAALAGWGTGRQSGVNWVGDLMLECDAKVEKADGTLSLELSRGVDRFQARFDLPTGVCKLVRITNDAESEVATQPTAVKKPGTYHLRFADFDQRLTVWVDNALPFGDGVDYEPKEPGPRKENDLERPASVGANGAGVRVDHLQLWRDTYYTVAADGSPSAGDVPGVEFANPETWDGLKQMPVRVMRVQPGHYLCMGDNSPESSDGRAWGLVPERLLLGRALLVYYPFNRAGRIR